MKAKDFGAATQLMLRKSELTMLWGELNPEFDSIPGKETLPLDLGRVRIRFDSARLRTFVESEIDRINAELVAFGIELDEPAVADPEPTAGTQA